MLQVTERERETAGVYRYFVKLQWLTFCRCAFMPRNAMLRVTRVEAFRGKRARTFYFGGICKPAITIDVYSQPVLMQPMYTVASIGICGNARKSIALR